MRTALAGEPKRLRRSQTRAPVVEPGGGRPAAPSVSLAVRSVIASPLDQGDAPVVPVHRQRDHQADCPIGQHGDGDALDRLAGLVQDRAGEDVDEVRVTDGHRQGRVLGDVEILAGERRNDDAQRLTATEGRRRAARRSTAG